jgi:hypothetical protein
VTAPSDATLKIHELMTRVVQQSFESEVQKRFGDSGVERLVNLLDTAKELFRYVPHEWMHDGATVITPLDPQHVLHLEGGGRTVVGLHNLSGRTMRGVTVVIRGRDTFEVVEHADHRLYGVVDVLTYRYIHGVSEEILVDGTPWPVEDTGWPCAMAVPIFSSLEEALDTYVALHRRPEYCAHIEKAWRGANRLAFLPKPERHLRRSLFLALRTSVRSAHVEQEQNQDETKPVDIEVTWWNPGRVAIIEVKWLGRSGPEDEEFTTTYKERRAVDGLKQLADYLNRRDGSTPTVSVTGYLFVFDGRRQAVTYTDTSIDAERGLHFADLDPRYPAELLEMPDIGRPFRLFLEPIVS